MKLLDSLPPPIRLSPIKSLLLALLSGPLPLSIMYFYMVAVDHPAANYRGLFDFYSASFGDFLVLPISWAVMARTYSRISASNNWRPSRGIRIISFGFGILLTFFIVYGGMTGDHRDWTLPQKGVINFPGIYHAVFMAFMLASFMMFLLDHWHITITSDHVDEDHILATNFWTVINLLTTFMVLLWLDGLYENTTTFWLVSPLQQVSCLVFIIINIILTRKYQLQPYQHLRHWTAVQLIWWGCLLGLIVKLSH